MPHRRVLAIALACLLWLCGISPTRAQDLAPVLTLDPPPPNTEFYEYRVLHNPDGIGKFYMGREIAQVMGHQGAAWLERPGRSLQEQPDKVLPALNLKPTDVVADIGAGTGYFSFRLSPWVPQGKVLAVDIQPEMIDILEFFKQEAAESGTPADNVEPLLGKPDDPQLAPESIDLALMVDAYHEFEYPREMMEAVFRALKPGGRVALVEYRGENPFISIKGLHKMTQRQVKKEMQAVGLVWQDTKSFLPQQHLMIFQKPAYSVFEASEARGSL